MKTQSTPISSGLIRPRTTFDEPLARCRREIKELVKSLSSSKLSSQWTFAALFSLFLSTIAAGEQGKASQPPFLAVIPEDHEHGLPWFSTDLSEATNYFSKTQKVLSRGRLSAADLMLRSRRPEEI